MTQTTRTPLYHDETHELLGVIAEENNSWVAQTIFGYTIERTTSRKAAETILRERGLTYVTGVWHYFDKQEKDWFPCILKDISEHRVTVVRTDTMGFQDPHNYKPVIILNPTEDTLAKG